MKAIVTRYAGSTNTKGSRIIASDMDGNRATVRQGYVFVFVPVKR